MKTNKIKSTQGEKIFFFFNYILLALLAMASLLPILNILAVSLSSKYAASTGNVGLWPIQFTFAAYEYAINNSTFMSTFLVSIKRVFVGVPLNILLIVLAAYPLSLSNKEFRGRSAFSWFFLFSMIFSGGLIPYFLVVNALGLVDSFWALIIPVAVPTYYVILMLNFFRAVPKELSESAELDGAGHWTILWKIYFPLSKTAIATILLLSFIFHWNSWFDGLLFLGKSADQPLQSYLQTITTKPLDVATLARNPEQWRIAALVSERTVKSAQIFIATIPILMIYPLAQKYFTKGILSGAIKG